MKIFLQREILAAYAHAKAGGQAIHLCDAAFVGPGAPLCFRGKPFAHLFDQDLDRLLKTAKSLGVRVLVPQHVESHRQHIDLTGKPLKQAIYRANAEADREKELRESILAPIELIPQPPQA
jgi:hypothetical protein